MKKSVIVIFMVFVLFFSCVPISGIAQTANTTDLSFTGYAETQDEQGRYLYLDIPYDTITPEGVEQLLMKKYGEIQRNEYNDNYHITDFGYPFYFAVNFNENSVGANRILLGKEGDDWGTGDAFKALYEKDIMQFVDMEAQLVQRYGEPNFRFFFTVAKNCSYLLE